MKAMFGFAIGLVVSVAAQAQSTSMFTPDEVRVHQERISTVTSTATSCLQRTWDTHVEFFEHWRISKYYGNRKPEHQTEAGRIAQLQRFGAPASLVKELEPISCVGLTMKCLNEGFTAAGQADTWKKIYAQMAIDNAFDGTNLQRMLRELGWKVMYWNPDPTKNAAWDAEDLKLNPLKPGRTWMPVWGGHAYRMAVLNKSGKYYGVQVDDKSMLVGFKKTQPAAFKQIPFFVGTAHAGYHVFPGFNGQIIEAHSMRELNSFSNLEVSEFNPLGKGGGPRWTNSEKYRSGLIVVPPTQ